MQKIISVRKKIYDHVFDSEVNCQWSSTATYKDYETFCIAKDTIQDTAEALLTHREKGFVTGVCRRLKYIEYYGVLQAIFMQQDSIQALQCILGKGGKLNLSDYPNWEKIRKMRNITVGHPVENMKRLNRNQISYNDVSYTTMKQDEPVESVHIDLAELIDAYENEASQILSSILINMQQTCKNNHAIGQ